MKIVLVDDHKMLRDGLRSLLERRADMHVVGEAADGHAALAVAAQTRPDIVVMDMMMPGLGGPEATRRLVAEHPDIKVIALSMHSDQRLVASMLSAGAAAYLLKSSASDELLDAIDAVSAGRRHVSRELASALALQGDPAHTPAPLSGREREVLQLLAEGLTSKEIAARLGLAVSTVDTHRKQIMAKLDLRTIAELTKYAVREGLTSIEH